MGKVESFLFMSKGITVTSDEELWFVSTDNDRERSGREKKGEAERWTSIWNLFLQGPAKGHLDSIICGPYSIIIYCVVNLL